MSSIQTNKPIYSLNAVGLAINGLKVRGMLLYILIVLSIGYLMDSFDTALISYLLPSIVKEWHLSAVQVGYVASGAMFGTVLGQILCGPMADALGRKRMSQITLFIFAVLTGVAAFGWDVQSLIVARFFAGMGLGAFVPLVGVTMSEMSPAGIRGRMVSSTSFFFPGGQLLAVGVTYLLLPIWGWRAMFIVGSVPVIIIWLAMFRMPESPRWLLSKGRHEETGAALQKMGVAPEAVRELASSAEVQSAQAQVESGSLGEFFSRKYFARIAVAFMTWGVIFGYFGFILWFPSLLVMRFHLTIMRSLSYTVLASSVGLVGRAVGIYLIDKIGRKPLALYCYTTSGIMLLLFMFVPIDKPTYILPLACLYYLFAEQTGIVQVTYPPELFPTHLRGVGTCWSIAFGRILAAFAPIIAGVFYTANHYNLIWIVFGGFYFVSAIVIGVWGIETTGKNLEVVSRVAGASA